MPPKGVPTWRWVAGGALGIAGVVLTWLVTSATAATHETATTVQQHGERLSAVEATLRASEARAERIERTVDKIDRKLDDLRK